MGYIDIVLFRKPYSLSWKIINSTKTYQVLGNILFWNCSKNSTVAIFNGKVNNIFVVTLAIIMIYTKRLCDSFQFISLEMPTQFSGYEY